MTMPFAGFKYPDSFNIGDHIQSLAAEQFIPSVTKRFNRDNLRHVKYSKPISLIMNGWFSHNPRNTFPPASNIIPIYWGLHLTNWNTTIDYLISSTATIDHLKLHSPIGCRDLYTHQKITSLGIESFYSKCLTLTFPKRKVKHSQKWIMIVDVPVPLPGFVESVSIRVSHQLSSDVSERDKFKQASQVLALYRDCASMVITSRLHCALPCIAMGIPVIFIGNPFDYRVSLISDLGLPIYQVPSSVYSYDGNLQRESLLGFWQSINWDPKVIDFESEKAKLIQRFTDHLSLMISKHQ